MCSAPLDNMTQFIRRYKKASRISFFTNPILVLEMKIRQCCSLLLLCLPCLIQGRVDKSRSQRNFVPYEALHWMEHSRNASGIEWWKVGTYNPRLYSWQPNHKNRGKLYTRKPHPPVRFGNRNHARMAKSLALKRPLALVVNALPGKSTKPVVNRFPPIIPHKIEKLYHPFQDAGCPFLAKVNTTDLAQDSACEFAEKRASRERRQITPDAVTELGLSEEQYRDLKARVNRRFLVGYDCSKPMEVKPISSFIRDPCEPVEDSDKATYDIQPVTQFQVVQYETRREVFRS